MQASQESALETAGEGEEGEAPAAFLAFPLPAGPSGEEGKPDAESPEPADPASNERGRSPWNHGCDRRPAGEPLVLLGVDEKHEDLI